MLTHSICADALDIPMVRYILLKQNTNIINKQTYKGRKNDYIFNKSLENE